METFHSNTSSKISDDFEFYFLMKVLQKKPRPQKLLFSTIQSCFLLQCPTEFCDKFMINV